MDSQSNLESEVFISSSVDINLAHKNIEFNNQEGNYNKMEFKVTIIYCFSSYH